MARSFEPEAAAEHAVDAFDVHAALVRTERDNPALKDNPIWTILRQDAYERFFIAMDRGFK